MNNKIVASWQENGMLYTVTAEPIITQLNNIPSNNNLTEMISVFDYLHGRTPDSGTGQKVFNHAKQVGAVIETKEINTLRYTGKIMMYERGFLDVYFNKQLPTILEPAGMPGVKAPVYIEVEDDDLPF